MPKEVKDRYEERARAIALDSAKKLSESAAAESSAHDQRSMSPHMHASGNYNNNKHQSYFAKDESLLVSVCRVAPCNLQLHVMAGGLTFKPPVPLGVMEPHLTLCVIVPAKLH